LKTEVSRLFTATATPIVVQLLSAIGQSSEPQYFNQFPSWERIKARDQGQGCDGHDRPSIKALGIDLCRGSGILGIYYAADHGADVINIKQQNLYNSSQTKRLVGKSIVRNLAVEFPQNQEPITT
jgi:hypothetical protein